MQPLARLLPAALAAGVALSLLGPGSAGAATTLTPRAATPKAVGFVGAWSRVLASPTCPTGSPATTRCLARIWMKPDKVGRPPEFNRHISYNAAVYPTAQAARRGAVGQVASIRALAPPVDTAYSRLVVRRTQVGDTLRFAVSYVYDGPRQRERLFLVQRGRRTASIFLGSDTPMGAFPVTPKPAILWSRLTYLAR